MMPITHQCIVTLTFALLLSGCAECSRPQTQNETTTLVAGRGYACALRGGAVTCASSHTSARYVVALPGPAVSVATAYFKTCAVLEDGRIFCWADAGRDGPETAPLEAPVSDATAIFMDGIETSAGRGGPTIYIVQACALRRDGRVSCWVGNGAVGDGADPPLALDTGPGAVQALAFFAEPSGPNWCAMMEGGGVRCGGHGPDGPVRFDTGVTARSLIDTRCAEVAGGTVQCWDWTGTSSVAGLAVSDELVDVAQVAPPCALKTDGTVLCWGQAYDDDALHNVLTKRTPVKLPGQTVAIAAAAGARGPVCALSSEGDVRCFDPSEGPPDSVLMRIR